MEQTGMPPTDNGAPTSAQPPAFLADTTPQAPSADRLTAIKAKVAELRDTAMEVADLEERLEKAKATKLNLETVVLPDMLQAVGMDKFGLEAEGNNPAYDLTIEPLVRANIAASWDEPKRKAGFAVLEQLGGGALIKTTVVFEFGGPERTEAKAFIENVFDEFGYEGEEKLTANHQSLGSWLKEEAKAGRVPSPQQLQAIGGFVGRTAKIKKRKER
jgi:hypothetical protein